MADKLKEFAMTDGKGKSEDLLKTTRKVRAKKEFRS